MGGYAVPQISAFPASTGPANYAKAPDPTQPFDNQDCPLGTVAAYRDGQGRVLLFKYVQLNSTTFPTLAIGPVYYKDETQQIVTTNESEAVAGINSLAGILLSLSAANLDFIWIQISGYLGANSDAGFGSGPLAPSSGVTKGDQVVGAAGQQVLADVAAGTAPGYRSAGIVLTTAASTVAFDLLVLQNYA